MVDTAVSRPAGDGAGAEAHPLFFHAIVLFLVALLLVVMSVIGFVQAAKASGIEVSDVSLKDAAKAEAEAKKTQSEAGRLTQKPTSVAGAAQQLEAAKRMGEKAKKLKAFLVPAIILVWGLGAGAAGFFVMKRANWARFAGAAAIAGTVIYYTVLQSQANGVKGIDFQVWRPIVVVVIAILAGKVLWDLFVEKFEAQAA